MDSKLAPHIVYRLTGHPVRSENADLSPWEIELSHIPLHILQRIFHAGPNNRLLEGRHVNDEKAARLQAYCAEPINTTDFRWEFRGRWSDAD